MSYNGDYPNTEKNEVVLQPMQGKHMKTKYLYFLIKLFSVCCQIKIRYFVLYRLDSRQPGKLGT